MTYESIRRINLGICLSLGVTAICFTLDREAEMPGIFIGAAIVAYANAIMCIFADGSVIKKRHRVFNNTSSIKEKTPSV